MDNYKDNEGKKNTNGKGKSKVRLDKKERQNAIWNDYTKRVFVELCEEEIRKGNRPGTYLSKDGWKNLVAKFNKKTGLNYTKRQMKNHWDTMKKEWRLFKNLMRGETGLGFDARRNTINVDDDWWEAKITGNIDYKKFTNKDLSLFWYKYDGIFSDIVATGERARAPSTIDYASHHTHSNDDYIDETNNENLEESDSEDLQYGTQNLEGINDTFPDDEVLFPPISNLNERPRACTTGKKRKTSGAAALKEDIHSLIKVISNKSSPSVVSQDNPTITQCMDTLKNLPGISVGSGLWFYGCNLFAKKEQREIFMGQPNDELKLTWLDWNYSEYCSRKSG